MVGSPRTVTVSGPRAGPTCVEASGDEPAKALVDEVGDGVDDTAERAGQGHGRTSGLTVAPAELHDLADHPHHDQHHPNR